MADEDRCAVCDDPTSRITNQILYCDGKDCDMPVHQLCYGVSIIPEGNWYCERCNALRRGRPMEVVCCPQQSGPLKRTQHVGKFMHIVCAAYNRDVKHDKEPYYYINKNLDTQQCYVCMKRQGLCLKCTFPGCSKNFHATCGANAGILAVGYPMPSGNLVRCNEHQSIDNDDIPLSSLYKRPGSPIRESPPKISKYSNENSTASSSNGFRNNGFSSSLNHNVYNASNNVGSSSNNNNDRPSMGSKQKSLSLSLMQQSGKSPFTTTTTQPSSSSSVVPSTANAIRNSTITPVSGMATASPSSSTAAAAATPPPPPPQQQQQRSSAASSSSPTAAEVELRNTVDLLKKELIQKQSALDYLEATRENLKHDLKKAQQKASETKKIQTELQEEKQKVETMRKELLQQKDFKRIVTDIMMQLNIKLANNTSPSVTKMDEYLRQLRDTLSRTGPPGEEEWFQITNFANKLAQRRK